jgi:hypothetical protein
MARSASRRANKDESLGIDSFRQPREEEGLSLESIGQAFAEMLATGDDPYLSPPDADSDPLLAAASETVATSATEVMSVAADASCALSPRTILEAMLFVGTPDNQPLAAEFIAGMMRGVRPAEIDDLVAELNRQYREEARPYSVISVGAGYRRVRLCTGKALWASARCAAVAGRSRGPGDCGLQRTCDGRTSDADARHDQRSSAGTTRAARPIAHRPQRRPAAQFGALFHHAAISQAVWPDQLARPAPQRRGRVIGKHHIAGTAAAA